MKNIKANKKYGQNFLKDQYILNKIIESMPNNSNTIVEIGNITAVDYVASTITADIANTTPLPTATSFILFGKDNRANMASLLGYCA